jgi:hypothetical protein
MEISRDAMHGVSTNFPRKSYFNLFGQEICVRSEFRNIIQIDSNPLQLKKNIIFKDKNADQCPSIWTYTLFPA